MNKELLTKNYDYELPQGFIATTPVQPRDHAKLLVYDSFWFMTGRQTP